MLPGRLWMQSSFGNSWLKEEITTSPLPKDFDVVPNWRQPCPVFMKLCRTWIHSCSVITSLHHWVTWNCTLYSYHVSVTLVRADCVYPGFGSQSASGGDVPSGTKPDRQPFEKAELAALMDNASVLCTKGLPGFWPSTRCPKTRLVTWWSLDRSRQNGAREDIGWVMPPVCVCMYMWIKAEKALQQQRGRQNDVQPLGDSSSASSWKQWGACSSPWHRV